MTKKIVSSDATKKMTMYIFKKGPHTDILGEYDFDEKTASKKIQKNTLAELVDKAIIGDTATQRIRAARAIVESNETGAGIAWLVLAREGAKDKEEALANAQKAVTLLKRNVRSIESLEIKDDFDLESLSFELSADALTLAIADLAQLTFNAGSEREAVDLLKLNLTDADCGIDSDNISILRDLAASFLIQMGLAHFLHTNAENDGMWHTLNALALFALEGNTVVARSALTHSLAHGGILARRLMDGKFSDHEPALAVLNSEKYIIDTETAWKNTKGALAWLKQCYHNPLSIINRDSQAQAEAQGDAVEWHRWERIFQEAYEHKINGNNKAASTEIRDALYRAEAISYSPHPFFAAASALIELCGETDEPTRDIRKAIDARLEIIDAEVSATESALNPVSSLHYQSLGLLLEGLDDGPSAITCHRKALEICEQFTMENASFLTLFEAIEIRGDLAFALANIDKHGEASTLYMINAFEQERYLGATHIELLEPLELARESFLQTGDRSASDQLSLRIALINSLYEDAEEEDENDHHDHHTDDYYG